MGLIKQDISFFTIFLGLQQREEQCINKLIASFLANTSDEKLTILDQSIVARQKVSIDETLHLWEADQDAVKQNAGLRGFDRRIDKIRYEKSISDNSEKLSVVHQLGEVLTHSRAINKVLTELCNTKWCVILDSDIEFINSDYFYDIVNIIQERPELAGIGEITDVPHGENSSNYKFSKNKGDRLMRIHPMLLAINRELFLRYCMEFKLIQFRTYKHEFEDIIGDCGASFFLQCALNNQPVFHLDSTKYILHRARGSWGGAKIVYDIV